MVPLLSALLLAACGQGTKEGGQAQSQKSVTMGKDFTPVLARVGDIEITQAYFDRRYKMLTPALQAKFSGENWKQRFLDELIDEALLYQEAEKEKFDQDPEVQQQLDAQRRIVLVKAYTHWIKENAKPTEEEVQDYWNRYKEQYRGLSRALVSHIQCKDKAKIDEAYAKLKKGEPFERVAHEYNEDPNTKDTNGLIGWINPGGFILGVGYDKTFSDTAFSLGFHEFSEPMVIRGKWNIIYRGDKVEGKIPSLDEVHDRVVEDLRPGSIRRSYNRKLRELAKVFPVERFGEFRLTASDDPAELYQRGAEARNPYARIDFYQQIVDHFPDSEYADDALFMIGFLHSEALNRPADAVKDFRRLMQEYPESEYVDDAEWMVRNSGRLGGENIAAENAQDLQGKIQGVRDRK